jgi:PGF-CTERM protein
LTVWHGDDGEWTALPTRVVNDTGESLVVEADTDGFSPFVITDATEKSGEAGDTEENNDPQPTTTGETPGFTVVTAIISIVVVVGMAARRRA